MELIFVTGNKHKFRDAQILFKEAGITLIQKDIETPEIQSNNAEEVAHCSAEYAGHILKKPLFVLDRSLHIESLKGFPGPFVKYVNGWLTAEQVISLVGENRNAHWISALGYYSSETGVKTFVGKIEGKIAEKTASRGEYMFDQIFVPHGYDTPFAELGEETLSKVQNECSCWEEFIKFLQG